MADWGITMNLINELRITKTIALQLPSLWLDVVSV